VNTILLVDDDQELIELLTFSITRAASLSSHEPMAQQCPAATRPW